MSNPWIVFHPILSLTWLLLIFFFLSAFLGWKEFRRKLRWRGIRLVALLVVMLALLGIALQPHLLRTRSTSVLLLTEGYSKTSADSVLQLHPDLHVMVSPDAKAYPNAERLSSWNQLDGKGTQLSFLLGDGPPEFVWDILGEHSLVFIPSSYPLGIVDVTIPNHVVENRSVEIIGACNIASTATLQLKFAGVTQDSVTLSGDGIKEFSLVFTPKQSGNFLYEISVSQNSTTTTDELPISVAKEQPLNILILHHQPTFETQYLKQFLADRHHKVTLRFQPSWNLFRFESINAPQVKIQKINSGLLASMDLIIIDQSTLAQLTSSELVALNQSIDNGLGLLVQVDEARKMNGNVFPFELQAGKADTVKLSIGKRPTTFTTAPVQIQSSRTIHPLYRDKTKIIVGFQSKGLGKTGFNLLEKTYPLLLSGDSLNYGRLWTPILEQLSRKVLSNSIVIPKRFPVYAEWPFILKVIDAREAPVLKSDSLELPLAEDLFVDGVWHTQIWNAPGWHTLHAGDGSELPYFVFEKGKWESFRIANQINKGLTQSTSATYAPTKQAEYRLLSPLIFYMILLIGMGVLWFVPKAG